MGKIVRRLMDGDETVIEWSAEDPASVQAAEKVLIDEREAGYFAVRYEEGKRPKPVTELEPDADEIVLTMPMGGG